MEHPILEDAKSRLQAIIDSSTTDSSSSLYLQQVAQAGLLALDTLPVGPEAQQLAGIVTQQLGDVHNSLQDVASIDEGLETDLIEFLGAVTQIQEEIPNLSEKVAAFEENLQEISARIAWRIVASDDSELAVAAGEETGSSPSHDKLTSQTTNGNNLSISNLLDLTNSYLNSSMPDENDGNPSAQSISADRIMALLRREELSGTTVSDVIPTDQLPDSSAELVGSEPSIRRRNQTPDFEETHRRGLDLVQLFERQGGLQNLSSSISLFRESLLLCPSESQLRLMATANLVGALMARYRQAGDYSDLVEAITQSYELLNLCPSGHIYRPVILNNLSIALLNRYQREGSLGDLSEATECHREALQLCPLGHPDHASNLSNLSNALLTRYEREGSLQDLLEAIECHRGALQLRPSGHPYRAESLNNLSNALFARYEREGSLEDLSEATGCHREALQLCPPGHPGRASSLNNLSNALLARYQREGNLQDLSEVIGCHREALRLRPPGHPNRASSLNNLSNALLTRYQREGCLQDLLEATEYHREALQLRPPGHPDRAGSLNNLSNVLFTRYQCEGNLRDLLGATECHREALQLCPPGHPDRAMNLNNLSNALFARYEREGSLQDLLEVTECRREALQLHPPGHIYHATSLGSLSNSLWARYQREGRLQDLLEATACYREALQLQPPGHPHRAESLNNLSNVLLTRYKREGSLQDLSEAIECHREAFQLRPPGHPYRAMSLNNLSNALLTRYQREGSLQDLSEATGRHREALELCPPGHPERTEFLSALCRTLLHAVCGTTDTIDIDSDQTLVHEVFEILREAVDLPDSPPLHRLRAALQWVSAAHQLASDSMLDAYIAALDLLGTVLATRDTLESKHSQLISYEELSQCRRLGAEAATCAVRQGHMALAVELLERGRNLLFAQVGRYRVDLEELRTVDAELAERFSSLSALLDASVVSNQPNLKGRTAFEDPIERYRRVSSAWNQTVDDIRAVEGFQDFLKSPQYANLRLAAAGGPIIIVIPGDGQSDALIITQEGGAPHHVNLPEAGREELVELANSLSGAVRFTKDRPYDPDAMEKPVIKILRTLWNLIVRPIADALENDLGVPLHSRIWWCPTSVFSALPLHAAGRYGRQDTNENIAARFVSSYTPTVQALLRAQRNRSIVKGRKMLIVAQPNTPGQSQLPNVQREAGLVKALVEGSKMEATLFSGEEGTHTAVLGGMVDHSWLHLTCHGMQNFDKPLQSCFALHDKQLTLQDIIQHGLPDATFAFLAACHTATGDRQLLDEGLHLAAGLQFAGFKSVVGTFWEVADIDGPVIAKAFYKALQDSRPDAEGMDCRRAAYALSEAVKELRDRGIPVHRWMRFIHIGI